MQDVLKSAMLGFTAVALSCASAHAQTVATGAGRDGELSEAARIDAYLADASRAPSTAQQGRVSAAEAQAGAGALPPMSADSPWARGVSGPTALPSSPSVATQEAAPCDHRLHGEAGAEIGTQGTRGGYGVVTAPVGKDCWGQVTVGVSSFHGPGYGGYGGYGYGGYGDRGYRGRDGTQDAFSFGFSTTDRRPRRAEDDLPPAF